VHKLIGVITGSGFYELGTGRKETIETGFGNVFVDILENSGSVNIINKQIWTWDDRDLYGWDL